MYYDTDTTIVSADYRSKDNLHICVDEDGHFVMRNMKEGKDFKKVTLEKSNYKYVKFNPMNEYQYFICSEESFKIYDVRNNLEMDSVEQFANSDDIFNDSSTYLLVHKEGLKLYAFSENKVEIVKDWNEMGEVTFCDMNSVNYTNPEIIVVGNENGDLYCSNLE